MAEPTQKPELDPELIKLPRPKTRIRPVTAMAVIGICLTLLIRLGSDLSFSRQATSATVITDISTLADHENQYVDIVARVDNPQALRLVPNRSKTGQVLVPVLGSGSKLWILLHASPWNATRQTDEHFQGRLTSLSDTDFEEALEEYLRDSHLPRPIALSEIRNALAKGTNTVRDVAGDVFRVTPDTLVRFNESATKSARILAVSTDRYRDEAAWSLALQGAGILPAGSPGAISSTTHSWTFDVPAPLGFKDIEAKIVQAKLFAATVSEISETREGTWAELSLDQDDILLGNPHMGYQVQSIALGVSPQLATSVYVLNTTEEPETYWYLPLLFGLIAAFALLFAFGLYRRFR